MRLPNRLALHQRAQHNTEMQKLLLAAAAWCLTLGPLFAWEKRDAFDSYPPGGDAAPAWDTGSINWEVQTNRFVATDVSKTFAFPADAPHGRRVIVEVTVTLNAAFHQDWEVAGIVVAQSPQDHWHLALIESPENRHAVELVESLDGHWLAQVTDTDASDRDRNHRPKFQLAIQPPLPAPPRTHARRHPRHRPRTRRHRTRPARLRIRQRAVTTGGPGLDNGGFHANFTDFAAQVDDLVPVAPASQEKIPPCTVTGDKARRTKPTGFFRVAEQGGRWWFYTPRGERFYAVGTDHVSYNAHWCEKLGYAPYHRVVEKLYGNEAGLGAGSVAPAPSVGLQHTPRRPHQIAAPPRPRPH